MAFTPKPTSDVPTVKIYGPDNSALNFEGAEGDEGARTKFLRGVQRKVQKLVNSEEFIGACREKLNRANAWGKQAIVTITRGRISIEVKDKDGSRFEIAQPEAEEETEEEEIEEGQRAPERETTPKEGARVLWTQAETLLAKVSQGYRRVMNPEEGGASSSETSEPEEEAEKSSRVSSFEGRVSRERTPPGTPRPAMGPPVSPAVLQTSPLPRSTAPTPLPVMTPLPALPPNAQPLPECYAPIPCWVSSEELNFLMNKVMEDVPAKHKETTWMIPPVAIGEAPGVIEAALLEKIASNGKPPPLILIPLLLNPESQQAAHWVVLAINKQGEGNQVKSRYFDSFMEKVGEDLIAQLNIVIDAVRESGGYKCEEGSFVFDALSQDASDRDKEQNQLQYNSEGACGLWCAQFAKEAIQAQIESPVVGQTDPYGTAETYGTVQRNLLKERASINAHPLVNSDGKMTGNYGVTREQYLRALIPYRQKQFASSSDTLEKELKAPITNTEKEKGEKANKILRALEVMITCLNTIPSIENARHVHDAINAIDAQLEALQPKPSTPNWNKIKQSFEGSVPSFL